MKVVPLGDKVAVRRLEAQETTAGGIVLPETAREQMLQGRVLSVGDGRLLRGALGLERGNQALLRLGLYLEGVDLGLQRVDEGFQAVELSAQLRRPDARAIRW